MIFAMSAPTCTIVAKDLCQGTALAKAQGIPYMRLIR